jgi:prepilin-type N-terminal cleavage/methylation domain-containing protein
VVPGKWLRPTAYPRRPIIKTRINTTYRSIPRLNRRHADSGFSLIELLVVISIVAVLIALTLPSLGKAREQGKIVTCASQQKQIGFANLSYANDYKQWFTGASYHLSQVQRRPFVEYLGYHSDVTWAQILACPSTRVANHKGSPTNSYTPGRATSADLFTTSYWFPGAWGNYPNGLTNTYFGWQSGWTGGSAFRGPDTSAPCPNVEFAGSTKRSVYTGTGTGFGTLGLNLWINPPSEQPMIVDAYAIPGGVWSNATTGDWHSNHWDGVNVLHVDGHGKFKAQGYIKLRHRQMWW